MSKKKGMSLEDKRKTIVGIYHSTKDVYNLKEIESAASKLGVVQQSVKDVNQGLVDDGLVETDKIGSGNFFWSFPGKALQQVKSQCKGAEDDIVRLGSEVATLAVQAQELQASRGDSKERAEMASKYEAELERKKAQVDALQVYKDNDPEEITKYKAFIELCKTGTNRWTDNTFTLKAHMVKKFNKLSREVDAFLCMDENFDSV